MGPRIITIDFTSILQLTKYATDPVTELSGSGQVVLSPFVEGDLFVLACSGVQPWNVVKDSILAQTGTLNSDSFLKGHITGEGLIFMNGYGTVMKKTVGASSLEQKEISISTPELFADHLRFLNLPLSGTILGEERTTHSIPAPK